MSDAPKAGAPQTPGLTARSDALLIEKSLEIAGERAGDLTKTVYGRLFDRQPAMKALFWRDSDDAIKGEMLMRTFEALLDFIGTRHFAGPMIMTEVVTHAGYDVPPEVFATFFPLVADVVQEACGLWWTPEVGAAWKRCLEDLDAYLGQAQAAL